MKGDYMKDDNNIEDKIDCFARINKEICNALIKKECKNCSFYKHKDDVSDYEEILKKGKKELLKTGKKD